MTQQAKSAAAKQERAMPPAALRQALADLEIAAADQSDLQAALALAKKMRELGGASINVASQARRVQSWLAGEASVPAIVSALLGALAQVKALEASAGRKRKAA